MKKTIITVCVISIALGCSILDPHGSSQGPVPDTELGLSKTSVFEVVAPDPVIWPGGIPGSNERFARSNPEFPPMIPHDTADHLPITVEDNVCIECHTDAEPDDKTPRIPDSHYIDLRRDPGKVTKIVQGVRYQCMSCHAPQSGALPLVGNTSIR